MNISASTVKESRLSMLGDGRSSSRCRLKVSSSHVPTKHMKLLSTSEKIIKGQMVDSSGSVGQVFPCLDILLMRQFFFYPHPRIWEHDFREGGRKGKKKGEKHQLFASNTHPSCGPNLNPRRELWLGIKPAAFRLPGEPHWPGWNRILASSSFSLFR